MMMILSTENKIKISKVMLKRFVKDNFDIKISDGATEELVNILEKKAKDISKYAVEKAKKNKRKKILTGDIESYKLKCD